MSMNAVRANIAIIGAGLGGLTAALALQRAGLRPLVLEQAPVLGDVGAGISVTPNASKALISLGLHDGLEQHGQAVPVQEVREGATGRLLKSIDRSDVRERYGAAYYMVHRADLHAMMVAAVRANDPDAILTGQKLASLAMAADGVEMTFDNGGPMCWWRRMGPGRWCARRCLALIRPSLPGMWHGGFWCPPVRRRPKRWRRAAGCGPGRIGHLCAMRCAEGS